MAGPGAMPRRQERGVAAARTGHDLNSEAAHPPDDRHLDLGDVAGVDLLRYRLVVTQPVVMQHLVIVHARRAFRPVRRVRALALATLLGALPGCTAFETNLQDTEVAYQDTARQNFEEGEKAMDEGRFAEAVKFFDHTKNKYPYSKYAVLAELRTADAHFAREKWLEAADAYRIFVRFHPTHEKVPDAMFRAALAHAREIDQDVWWAPSAVEKDQTAAREAIRSFDEFLARFPKHDNAAEAKKLRTDARARLASTDLYAAGFYEKRRKWQGALWRYERVANEFADTPGAAGALLRAARIADEHLDDAGAAARLYEQLVRQHPESSEAADAREALAALAPPASRVGPTGPAPASVSDAAPSDG